MTLKRYTIILRGAMLLPNLNFIAKSFDDALEMCIKDILENSSTFHVYANIEKLLEFDWWVTDIETWERDRDLEKVLKSQYWLR